MTERKLREVGMQAARCSQELGFVLNRWLTDFGPSAIYVTCQNCKHMTTEGPANCMKYNMVPPMSVIMQGCPAHEDVEDIPF